jgi:hypothetical protein
MKHWMKSKFVWLGVLSLVAAVGWGVYAYQQPRAAVEPKIFPLGPKNKKDEAVAPAQAIAFPAPVPNDASAAATHRIVMDELPPPQQASFVSAIHPTPPTATCAAPPIEPGSCTHPATCPTCIAQPRGGAHISFPVEPGSWRPSDDPDNGFVAAKREAAGKHVPPTESIKQRE